MIDDARPAASAPLSRADVFRLAWPMVFANATVPLAGVADTAVIGAVGDKHDLGGVALGVLLFNVFFFSCYFLRMSSTGLAAQADGAHDRAGAQRVLVRALALAGALGALVIAARYPIAFLGFRAFQGGDAVEAVGASYFLVRAFGAPGAFAMFALTGWLIGLGRTRAVMIVSIVMSTINIALDLWLVLDLGLGARGVAAATAVAETTAALVAIGFVLREVRRGGGWEPEALAFARLVDPVAIRRLFAVNLDLIVRTWSLVFGFAWFNNVGARQGDAVLAGNHVLLQIVTVTAFVLDAFAFVAETEVGRAVGARSAPRLRRAIRLTSEFALAAGLAFMLATLAFGPALLRLWIADPDAQASAIRYLPYTALAPLLGAAAWQLDGVFIGATRSAAMRNAAVAAVVIYIALDRALTPPFGPTGMWLAFLGYYVARGATLAVAYPALERAVKSGC